MKKLLLLAALAASALAPQAASAKDRIILSTDCVYIRFLLRHTPELDVNTDPVRGWRTTGWYTIRSGTTVLKDLGNPGMPVVHNHMLPIYIYGTDRDVKGESATYEDRGMPREFAGRMYGFMRLESYVDDNLDTYYRFICH